MVNEKNHPGKNGVVWVAAVQTKIESYIRQANKLRVFQYFRGAENVN